MKMEQKTNDEFMRNILVEEAWKDLSLGFAWSESLLTSSLKKHVFYN